MALISYLSYNYPRDIQPKIYFEVTKVEYRNGYFNEYGGDII
jgi:hypothetical protein